MRPIDLNYQTGIRRHGWVGWLLLAVAAAFWLDLGFSYATARGALQNRQFVLADLSRTAPAAAPATVPRDPKTLEDELKFADGAIHRLALPWDELFRALESATTKGVALLSVEPDPDGGEVILSGEAADLVAMLNYLARLEEVRFFKAVRLKRHEVKRGSPQRSIAFVITSTWRTKR
jgi:hypothetical protein